MDEKTGVGYTRTTPCPYVFRFSLPRWSNVGKKPYNARLENSSSRKRRTSLSTKVATLERRLHLTRFRPSSLSLPPLFLPPPLFFSLLLVKNIYKNEKTPPSLFAVLPLLFWASLSGDCYRRTDHAVIRDYIYPERVGGDDGKDPVTPDNGAPPFLVFYFFWCQQLKGIIVIKRIPNKQTKIDSRKCSLIQ